MIRLVKIARGCFTNWTGHQQGPVFGLPKEENLRNQCIKFMNRKDFDAKSLKYAFVCEKHFEENYLNKKHNSSSFDLQPQSCSKIVLRISTEITSFHSSCHC